MEKILAETLATIVVIGGTGIFWFFYGKYKREKDENSANAMRKPGLKQIKKEVERRAKLKQDF